MRTHYLVLVTLICYLHQSKTEETRLLDLDPNDAQNIISQQDQTLKYAPKIDTSVPAVRYLGEEPHNVLEDIYLAKQYHGQDGLGGYLYGYQVPDIAKNEEKKASGDLKGAYNYVNGAGQEIKVEYWDNGNGFHQTDNIPQILPQQIDDSPEVKAAKDAFLKRWQEEAERNTHPVQDPYNSEGQYASGPLSAQGQQERAQLFAQQQQYSGAAYSQQKPIVQQQPQHQYQGAASGQHKAFAQQPGYQGAASIQQSAFAQQPQGAASGQHIAYAQQPRPQGGVSAQQNAYSQQPQPAGSVQQNVYSQQSGSHSQQQQQQNDDGEYKAGDEGKYIPEEGEESTGPPKGFFYAFDYPVGIIVQDQGRALNVEKSGNLKNVYEQNKERFERQLQQGSASSSNNQYLVQ